VRSEAEVEAVEAPPAPENVQYHHADYDEALGHPGEAASTDEGAGTFVRDGQKVGRNDPCPCGSGKKYKQCHGKLN
jgi:preprotein translocase subunit SecA